MAKHQKVTYTDDLGGQGEAAPVRFSFQGQVYEVDLNKRNTDTFNRTLKRYIEAARPIGAGDANVNYAAVRAWARENNMPVPNRGLISGDVIKAYTLAHV